LDDLVLQFEEGLTIEASNQQASSVYISKLMEIDTLREATTTLDSTDISSVNASCIEFMLEGLHLRKRLNKEQIDGTYHYRL
jgi:magnesium chelatase subunit I